MPTLSQSLPSTHFTHSIPSIHPSSRSTPLTLCHFCQLIMSDQSTGSFDYSSGVLCNAFTTTATEENMSKETSNQRIWLIRNGSVCTLGFFLCRKAFELYDDRRENQNKKPPMRLHGCSVGLGERIWLGRVKNR